MTEPLTDPVKATLHEYLRSARATLLWKLEGLSEWQLRTPMVDSGTNLLGILKHCANVEAGYFSATFDRPFPEPLVWEVDQDPNADWYAGPGESADDVIGFARRAWRHADDTIEALPIDAPGTVAWWGGSPVTLHRILVHVLNDISRHCGHADILREQLDGAVGYRKDNDNMAGYTPTEQQAHLARLREIAESYRTGRLNA